MSMFSLRRTLRAYRWLLVLWMVAVAITAQQVPEPNTTVKAADAQEIVRKSLSHWRRNMDAARNYTFQKHEVTSNLEKDGDIKNSETKTYDVFIIYGDFYEKLVAKDDKPLDDKEQKKEQEKFDKYFEEQKKKSDEERARERQKEKEKFQREIADELPNVLTFTVIGDDQIDHQATWILSAEPVPGADPHSRGGKLLSKLRGKIWIT